MTLAIKIGDDTSAVQGLIYFDVVTQFSEDVSGDVANHPLDMGASIVDHYSAKNISYQLKGVLSAVDLTGVSGKVRVDGKLPSNAADQPQTPTILDFAVGVAKYLPGSVSQFYKTAVPEVVDGGSRTKAINHVRDTLREVMSGVQYSNTLKRYQNKMTTCTIYEMDGSSIVAQHTDLVITKFSVDEDVDTGDSLPISMSLEKVRFVSIEKVEPKSKPKTRKTVKKGVKTPPKQQCTAANGEAAGASSVAGEPRLDSVDSIFGKTFKRYKGWTE